MERGQVDLRTCKPGDILVSVHGAVLVYEAERPRDPTYPHLVRFIHVTSFPEDRMLSTRTNDGYVWVNGQREKHDHDIVLIIPKELLQTQDILGVTE